jgi:hypothetical protein
MVTNGDKEPDMTERRKRSISAKVTEAEYVRLVAQAGDKTISEWLRKIALETTTRGSLESLVLDLRGEVRALRTILLNLQYATNRGERLSAEAMQHLIDNADEHQVNHGRHLVPQTTPRSEP